MVTALFRPKIRAKTTALVRPSTMVMESRDALITHRPLKYIHFVCNRSNNRPTIGMQIAADIPLIVNMVAAV